MENGSYVLMVSEDSLLKGLGLGEDHGGGEDEQGGDGRLNDGG